MARIAGVNLPLNKRIEAALLAVAGIGKSLAKKVCVDAKIDLDKKVKDLNEKEEDALRTEVAKYHTEGDLRRIVNQNIKLLQDIGNYRGKRHKMKLPSRGQRTRSNARTKRGAKRTVAGKKIEKK